MRHFTTSDSEPTQPKEQSMQTRRKTLKQSAIVAALLAGAGLLPQQAFAFNAAAFDAKNLADALNWHRRIIPVLKDCYQIDINCRPQLAIIEFVATWQDLGKWFRGNQIKRALNTNDNRHRDRSPRKSPLLYNLRDKKENARCEDLLQTALTNPEDHKDLVNFDDEKECFIWFECEGTNNQYHAYHLVKSEKGERDISSKGERKISDTLRHVFEHLHPGCFR